MKILEIVTEHTGPFKILFEVLKDILTETNIEVRSTVNKEGRKDESMRITAVDPTKTAFISLKLDGSNFTKFHCASKSGKILAGINLGYFHKLVKSMGKNDILSLIMEHDSKSYLQIKINSPDENKDSKFRLKLMDIAEDTVTIPDIEFTTVIKMDSQEFNKLCREMNSIAEYVEIKCLANKIIFTCKGDIAERTTTYANNNDPHSLVTITHKYENPEIIQGVFELKNLVLFSKCASLCDYIEIFMKNNFALVIKYTIATLGRILLCLTPISENAKTEHSGDEEYYSDPDGDEEEDDEEEGEGEGEEGEEEIQLVDV